MRHSIFLFTQYLIAAEALAAIAGCLTWNKWKHNYFKWFVIYLLIILIFELSTHFLVFFKMKEEVPFVNQIVASIEILFINWFFYKILIGSKKKIIVVGAAAYITALALEKTLIDTTNYYFDSLSYTVGNLFILVYLILFFIEFANSEKILAFKKQTIFWIALGLLVFYLGTFPFFGLYNELMKNMDIFTTIAWTATALNYSMYILFTIGLIWGKPG